MTDWETGFDFVFESQQIFRLLLDAMARPGKINRLPRPLPAPAGISGYTAAVAFTLLDGEVTFAALGADQAAWSSYLISNIRAVPAGVEHADFIIAPGERANAEVGGARRGTLLFPERGATVLFTVETIADDSPAALVLSGPGIRGTAGLTVAGIAPANLELLAGANSEYPLGIDAIFIGRDGALACLPRSTKIERKVKA